MEDARWTMPLLFGSERGLRPCCDTAGVGCPGVRMHLPLPHMLDCCTDSTGAGGPARLLHVGWLYCIKAALGGRVQL